MSNGRTVFAAPEPGRMGVLRPTTAERIAGLLTALLGVGGVAIAAFAPLSSNSSCETGADGDSNCSNWSSSLWQDERGAALALVLVVAPLSLIVAAGAIADTNGGPRRRPVLTGASALLVGSAVLMLASVGLFIIPAALAAITASLAAHLRSDQVRSDQAKMGLPR